MPFIKTTTNLAVGKEQEQEIKSRLGEAIGLLGKSESWLMLDFNYSRNMYFKGQNMPMAFVDVSVFGNSTDEQCAAMTKEICSIFNEVLGLEPERVYVKYTGTNQWGWNNMNF